MKKGFLQTKEIIKQPSLIFLSLVMISSANVQAHIPYGTIVKGTVIGAMICGVCVTSTLAYLTKKLKKKYVTRNDRLSAYYVQHDCYLHLFAQRNMIPQKQKSCIMYLHGIGGHNKEMRTLFGQEQQYLLNYADYIVPCIEFTHYNYSYYAPFFNTDFGQEQDLLTVLDALKNLFLPHVDQYDKLIIMGRSRGGAITTNLIGVLSTQGHYLLEQSGISELERLLILEKLTAGGIILAVPLISLEYALQNRCGRYMGSLLYYTTFSKITQNIYKTASKLKPLFMIQKWSNLKIPVFVIMATDDAIVGTKYNAQFLQKIEKYNGIASHVTYITGGHRSPCIYTKSVAVLNNIMFGEIHARCMDDMDGYEHSICTG